jgi:hypothetical protein
VLIAAIALDIVFQAEIAVFLAGHALAATILCALAALAIAALLNSIVTGQFFLGEACLKWLAEPSTRSLNIILLAALLFVVLLLRYSLVSFFKLSPTTLLVFAAIIVCIIWLCRLKKRTGVLTADERKRDLGFTMAVLVAGMLLGLYLVVAAVGYAPKEYSQTAERTAMGWALAYFAILFLVGFLFGIPRVLQGDAAAGEKKTYEQRVNTNLEQISDWLTKIIVGLGLVQLNDSSKQLYNAATWMAQSFAADGPPSPALISFCGGFIIYFSVLGFFAGYLSTRLFLSAAFYRADRPVVVFADQPQYDPTDSTAKQYLSFIEKPENRAKVETWLASQGKSNLKPSDIVAGTQYAELRQQALAKLNV